MNNQNKINTKQVVVKEADLPLSCSGLISTSQQAFDAHPKIYLPVKENKIIICPYCGIEYIFVAK